MEDYVRGYKYRIYPTQEQEAKFNQMFGNARVVFNYFLNIRQTCCRGSFLCVMRLFPCLLLAKKETPKGVSWGVNMFSQTHGLSKESRCVLRTLLSSPGFCALYGNVYHFARH